MRVLSPLALLGLFLSTACMGLVDGPTATIHVFNDDAAAVEIRITDNDACQLGMTTQLNQRTRTTYDVDAAKGGFLCVGAGATVGVAVKPEGFYMVKGGALVIDPNPEAAGAASGGLLDILEAAGNDSKGH